MRELIHKDRERRLGRDRLEQLLIEGVASGPAAEWTDAEWAAVGKRVVERLEAGSGSEASRRDPQAP